VAELGSRGGCLLNTRLWGDLIGGPGGEGRGSEPAIVRRFV